MSHHEQDKPFYRTTFAPLAYLQYLALPDTPRQWVDQMLERYARSQTDEWAPFTGGNLHSIVGPAGTQDYYGFLFNNVPSRELCLTKLLANGCQCQDERLSLGGACVIDNVSPDVLVNVFEGIAKLIGNREQRQHPISLSTWTRLAAIWPPIKGGDRIDVSVALTDPLMLIPGAPHHMDACSLVRLYQSGMWDEAMALVRATLRG